MEAVLSDEIGYQADGLKTWGALIAETHEPNPELQWPKSIDVFDRMRREDAQVGSVMRAVTLPIRRTDWMIDPAGARDEVVEHIATDLGLPIKGRTYVAPVRSRGRFSWSEHLRLALLHLPFGHSIFEQVYRVEDNRVRLAKLAFRPHRTISDVKVAADGGLVEVVQYGTVTNGAEVRIPVDRLVVYVNEREGANWLGQSLLRGAYKNWLLKDRILRIQMLTAERNGLGVPVYTGASLPTDRMTTEEAQAWNDAERAAGLKLTKGFRAGEAAGASVPPGAKLELLGVNGKLPDTGEPIRYHDEQIARAVLAHFLNLGTETGSWALGSTFANFFTDSLNAVAGELADVAQQHIVEDLVDLNWGPTEPAPRIVAAPIGAEHPATAEAIKALIDSGAIHPDNDLEAYMRERYGLPVADANTAAQLVGAGVDESTAITGVRNSQAAQAAAEISDAELARTAAEVAQKVYLATDRKPLTIAEARDLIRRSGAALDDTTPAAEPAPTDPPEESE